MIGNGKHLILVALVIGVLAGCSGGKKYQSWPMESEVQGTKYHYHNAVQLDLPTDTFHGVVSWTHVEVCITRLENPTTQDEHLYPFHNCKIVSPPVMLPLASVAQQMVAPVAVSAVQAGGMVGLGYFIGDGLKKSGTTVNQSGGGAQSSSHAEGGDGGSASNMANSGNHTTNVKPTTNINSGNKIITK